METTTMDVYYELALGPAQQCIAMGLSKDETRAEILAQYSRLAGTLTLEAVLTDAKREAIAFGIEREDMDDSWF